MRGVILTFIIAAVIFPVVGIVLFVGIEVAGPFFVEMGDTATVAGTSANDAIDMKLALALTAASVLAIPGYAAVKVFTGRRRRRRRF